MKKLPKIDDGADLIEQATHHKEKVRVIEYEEYFDLLISGRNHPYPIAKSRINTSAKVLGWLHHLSEKEGMTTKHVRALIEAAERLGAKVDYSA